MQDNAIFAGNILSRIDMTLQALLPVTIAKNVVNVHGEPSSNSELVSQAIAGQPAWALRSQEGWLQVQLWDAYTGWVQERFTVPLEQGKRYPGPGGMALVKSVFADVYEAPSASSALVTRLVVSSELDLAESRGAWQEVSLPGGVRGWLKRSDLLVLADSSVPCKAPKPSAIVKTALRFIGTPYLWGGATPFGLDCSGLVQLTFRINGCCLPRDAYLQARDPRARDVNPNKIAKGDLLFFSGPHDTHGERITHVGIYAGDGHFVHSSGDGAGVIVSHLFHGYYWDVFCCARRYVFNEVDRPNGRFL